VLRQRKAAGAVPPVSFCYSMAARHPPGTRRGPFVTPKMIRAMERAFIVAITGMLVCAAAPVDAQTLRGSPQAMQLQNSIARQHDYTFLQSGAQVRRFVEAGYLVRLPGSADYELASVSYPYARPAVKLFVERLAAQYRAACGEKLVVTSLTRPVSEQPNNASALSVHPAGMAVDLRISGRTACRTWLERTLLSLEKQGVLNAIRENRPPHYHVALYPNQYTQYVTRVTGQNSRAVLASATVRESTAPTTAVSAATQAPAARTAAAIASELARSDEAVERYRVNRGDSLWSIARRHGTTVDVLKALNNLRGTSIVAGQVLSVPSGRVAADVNP
jgi:LysM repeat protein